MCGIVGYFGKKQAQPVLMGGLSRLEYRGYDSSGIATLEGDVISITKAVGKVSELADKISVDNQSSVGIAHTRWATHGKPTENNAHPHRSNDGTVAVVHNGIIENYKELKEDLKKDGFTFISETDTEVIAHLVRRELNVGVNLVDATRSALNKLKGTYGLIVMSSEYPDYIVAARMGSPLILGVGDDEHYIASDASAILRYTRQMVYLDDGELVVVGRGGFDIRTLKNEPVKKAIELVEEAEADIQKMGYPHFMMKEMMEQPDVLMNSTRGRLDVENGMAILGGLRDVAERLRDIERIIIVGCGSAYYAGLVGEYMLEEYAGIPVEVELGSEFRYRKPIISKNTAVIAISQSGETADTLAAVREAKEKGALTLGIVNAVGSTIARETDAGVYNHAGPEIGVASTKAYVSQVTVLALFTLFLGRQRSMSLVTGQRIAKEILELPDKVRSILVQQDVIGEIGLRYKDSEHAYFLGRKYCNPIAMEGALKLKEISYIHAEGYAAGEMKHGPIALIEDGFPVVVLAPKDSVFEKSMSNLEEIRARGGRVIMVTTEGVDIDRNLVDDVIFVPKTLEMLTPILAVIPLQLLAYFVTIEKGLDPDMPRNLAKSVTVE
ncbi:MAG TPA: glutamine--fructose-6-phosphate transaminase (isomerizing) [Patescibacteria group bacterium]|nr:glutamine--fructose-6-phosphate transaminase (isomerizing) [Patescibacteria group bacterium]